MLKESTLLKGNLCIYKSFIDVLSIFDRVFKKNWEMRQIVLVPIFPFAQPILLVATDARSSQCYVNCFNGKLMGFRVNIFKKQFACLLLSVLFIHKIS